MDRLLALGGGLAVVAFGVAGCALVSAERDGASLAREKCASCHSLGAGRGQRADAPGFAKISVRHTRSSLERELQAISAVGHYDMPRIALSQAEIESLVVFMQRNRPPDDRPNR